MVLIYPGGDYPVSVGIGNSDTIFSWLAYNMIIPKNSSIELCEAPKRLGIGQSIFAIIKYSIRNRNTNRRKTKNYLIYEYPYIITLLWWIGE